MMAAANKKQRHLPPLEGSSKAAAPVKSHQTHQTHPSSHQTSHQTSHQIRTKANSPSMVITGHRTTGRGPSTGRSSEHINDITSSHSSMASYQHDSSSEQVKSYLRENPDVLENFILQSVSQDQLERWIVRKSQKQNQIDKNGVSHHEHTIDKRDELVLGTQANTSQWKLENHSEKRRALQEMTREIYKRPNKAKLLGELSVSAASAVKADGYNLYIVDDESSELIYFAPDTADISRETVRQRPIGAGSTVAAFVASSQRPVRIQSLNKENLTADYPDGIGTSKSEIISVLAQPILTSAAELVGVVELYRHDGSQHFTEADEEMMSSYLMWGGCAFFYAEECSQVKMYHTMTKQRKLNEFLLTVTKSIFQDIVSMDTVIMKIMNFAQKLVNADRASLFLVDSKTQELYARIFDIGTGMTSEALLSADQKEIRFPLQKGIAGYVAATGNILNIKDAYSDERFNREVDQQTGYVTKTLLCMPIFIRGSVIGVVQMVNKLTGCFTKADEDAFETFAVYCGLALHHAKLYDKIRRSEQKYKVALEVLTYHNQCTEEEFTEVKERGVPDHIDGIDSIRYSYHSMKAPEWEKPMNTIYMFQKLFGAESDTSHQPSTAIIKNSYRFDEDVLVRFTLTVRKNYRRVPYHNWTHGFSVAHAMYVTLVSDPDRFNPKEALAMYVGSLCHDLDHRGRNNAFMSKTESPLAAIYSTSVMEHHHFNQTVSILQQEGHNIFRFLSSDEYKEILGLIKQCILATDLALFFPNKAKLKSLIDSKSFDWGKSEHRMLVQAILMTGCDLCASVKPWDIQVQTVKVIFAEFYEQGDIEKQQGRQPIPMMDRDRAHELPASQVGFLLGICIPCYELMATVMPATKRMLEGGQANLAEWKKLADEQKEKEEKAAEEEKAKRKDT